MSQDAFPVRCPVPSVFTTKVRLLGTGAANPTELYGDDVVVTWVATGRYLLTFARNPGTFVGYAWGLQSTTIANTKGCTVTVGEFSTTAYTLEVDVWSSAFAARDLAAAEWLNLSLDFQRLGN